MNVMVVEDDLISRKWLQRFLGKWGYEVTSYPDGEAAWAALDSGEQPVLVLADWMMPKMDGVELCRMIRNNPKTQHAYVIILTARSEKADLISGLEAGADDYLVKPVDPDELKTRLRVGERTLSLRDQLAERIHQLESMLRRHQFLGEAYTRSFLAAGRPDSAATGSNEPGLDGIGALLARCFEQMGWTRRLMAVDATATNAFEVGSVLVLPDPGKWIDLSFRVPEASANWWFESMMGRPPADQVEVADGLIEAVNILQSALRSALGAAGQVAYAPFHPTPAEKRAAESADDKHFVFEAGGAQLLVVMRQVDLTATSKKMRALTETDVLGESVVLESVDGDLTTRFGCTPTAEWLSRVASMPEPHRSREVRVLSRKQIECGRLFDPGALLHNTEGDQELCQELVRCFLGDNSTAFDEVSDAVERGDWAAAVEAAHSLKGSVSYFSRDVSRDLGRVETAARHQDAPSIAELAPEIRRQLAQLIAELTAFLETSESPEARAS